MRVFFGTSTGTSKRFAESLAKQAKASGAGGVASCTVSDLKDCDAWELLDSAETATNLVVVVILSTWTGGVAPEQVGGCLGTMSVLGALTAM